MLHLHLTIVRAKHYFLIGSNVPALTPVISHLLPGQIARPQITRRRPPKLPNRLWVIRQVSHCGKPQRTGSQPLGCFLNLPEGLCPLGTPSEVSYLCTPWHTKCFQIFRKVHRTFLHIFHHFAKGLLAPCIPRQRFHPCNLVIIYYIQYNTLCNK